MFNLPIAYWLLPIACCLLPIGYVVQQLSDFLVLQN
jgi:hypothetical protein